MFFILNQEINLALLLWHWAAHCSIWDSACCSLPKTLPVFNSVFNSVFQAQAVVPSVNLHSQNPRLLQSPGLSSASGAETFSFPPSSCQGEAAFMEEERVETPKVQLETTLGFVSLFFLFFPEIIPAIKCCCLLKAQQCFLKFKYLSIKSCRCSLSLWLFSSFLGPFWKGGKKKPKKSEFLSLVLLKSIFKGSKNSSFAQRGPGGSWNVQAWSGVSN